MRWPRIRTWEIDILPLSHYSDLSNDSRPHVKKIQVSALTLTGAYKKLRRNVFPSYIVLPKAREIK